MVAWDDSQTMDIVQPSSYTSTVSLTVYTWTPDTNSINSKLESKNKAHAITWICTTLKNTNMYISFRLAGGSVSDLQIPVRKHCHFVCYNDLVIWTYGQIRFKNIVFKYFCSESSTFISVTCSGEADKSSASVDLLNWTHNPLWQKSSMSGLETYKISTLEILN